VLVGGLQSSLKTLVERFDNKRLEYENLYVWQVDGRTQTWGSKGNNIQNLCC
jgi:hypothetical protein